MLTRDQVLAHYDAAVDKQDRQGYYEAVALAEIYHHGGWPAATAVVEFGCGTGLFARRLLADHLPAGARYLGLDMSPKMTVRSRRRVADFGARAAIARTDGSMALPLADTSCDRFASNYVLDLLAEADIEDLLDEAHRVIRPSGLLCVTGLTQPCSARGRVVTGLWKLVHRLRPQLVGGCRPLEMTRFLAESRWRIVHHRRVEARGIASEALIAAAR